MAPLLRAFAAVAAFLLAAAAGAPAAGKAAAPAAPLLLEEEPRYGVRYDRIEPAFYTGFAPRVRDPRRAHLHIGRGNQLRATLVLGQDDLAIYPRDLAARRDTIRRLVAEGRLVLTQNRAFDEFERTLESVGLDSALEATAAGGPAQVATPGPGPMATHGPAPGAAKGPVQAGAGGLAPAAARGLELLETLNPGRVFRQRFLVDDLYRRWAAGITAADRAGLSPARRVELLEAMLPTRLYVEEVTPSLAAALESLVHRSRLHDADGPVDAGARAEFAGLLERATGGLYPRRGDALEFVEFTAVWPIGTLNDTVPWRGRRIPLYPTPGRRDLVVHQRTRVVDHIPDDPTYSYFPWIPYIHIGTRLHDALHTLFWKMKPAATPFLPEAWRTQTSPEGKPWEYLWLLSRGPMSHGCTHVNAGHISELRQMLPAAEKEMGEVDLFHNRSEHYDVFDVDGDHRPEVMGVAYWIAFSLKGETPDRLRVRNERRAYYDWLYAGDVAFPEVGAPRFAEAQAGAFAGRKAEGGAVHRDLELYEAAYEPERVQFYQMAGVPFARELRRVGADHPFVEPPPPTRQ